MRFPTAKPESALSRLPAAFRHAAPFKLGDIGAWTFWLLAAALLLGAPLLLGRALLRADAADR